MADFSESQAHELANSCLMSEEFLEEAEHLMIEFKDKDLSLSLFNKKMRKLRRDTTSVKTGVAKSTGALADDMVYSALSSVVFGTNIRGSAVEEHKQSVVSGTVPCNASGVGTKAREPQVGDYFRFTGERDIFGEGSVVQLEGGNQFKLIEGSCDYNNAKDGSYGAFYSVYQRVMEYLPDYTEEHEFKVGQYYEVIKGNWCTIGSIVRLENLSGGAHSYRNITGSSRYNLPDGSEGSHLNHDKVKYLPMYVESAVPPVPAPNVPTQAGFEPLIGRPVKIKQQPKETIMKASDIINTQTNVFGTNAAHLTDEEVFVQIARVDAEIERMEKCTTKPKKLQAKIADMKEALSNLVKFVDSRD